MSWCADGLSGERDTTTALLETDSMPAITKPKAREIITDFAREICTRRLPTAKPSTQVINFRNDRSESFERDVWKVPIEILRYRKDNGRIASDVLDYERNIGVLDEKDEESQATIADFLRQKDPEKTDILRKTLLHIGQREEAIITCDGFLINGNRRKMVMDQLHAESPEDERFAFMKAVILPGEGEPGGPPTLLEIERIENRYQLQSDGKAEYDGFDRALSIKRKIELGLTLEEQLRDDPQFAGATKAELAKAKKKYEKDYLHPLKTVERYLKQFGREGQYRTISTGMSDREGRWQAFIDYSETYTRDFSNQQKLLDKGIEEEEIGEIEEAAFDIIRLRTIPDMPKVHMIMRKLFKYCSTKEGKKEILKIAQEVERVLPAEEYFDKQRNPLPPKVIDAKWVAKNQRPIIHRLKSAANRHDSQKERETPLTLLEAAYKKLTHNDMELTNIEIGDFKRARDLAIQIRDRADELEGQIYHQEKQLKKLLSKRT